MSFLDQAKEVLDEAKVARLAELAKKSADFDTSSDEDTELFNLKAEVKKAIATRDREKNLTFLKDGGYTIEDILRFMKADEKSIKDALKTLHPTDKAVYVPFDGVLATYGTDDYKLTGSTRALGAKVKAGGEATFVANLTEGGKEWMLKSRKKNKGTGVIHYNVNAMASRFKFDKNKLMDALGINKKEEAKQTPEELAKELEATLPVNEAKPKAKAKVA